MDRSSRWTRLPSVSDSGWEVMIRRKSPKVELRFGSMEEELMTALDDLVLGPGGEDEVIDEMDVGKLAYSS